MTVVSATNAPLTLGQEIGPSVVPSATGDQGKDDMETDDVNIVRCFRQPTAFPLKWVRPGVGRIRLRVVIITKGAYNLREPSRRRDVAGPPNTLQDMRGVTIRRLTIKAI